LAEGEGRERTSFSPKAKKKEKKKTASYQYASFSERGRGVDQQVTVEEDPLLLFRKSRKEGGDWNPGV